MRLRFAVQIFDEGLAILVLLLVEPDLLYLALREQAAQYAYALALGK